MTDTANANRACVAETIFSAAAILMRLS